MSNTLEDKAFDALTGQEAEDRSVGSEEPGNFLRHAASLSMTKVADGLIDPKLVLSWLLNMLGASSVFVGLLVPIREAGALLPQLFTSARIARMRQRKWAWSAGSLGQGLAAAGIVLAALVLEGAAAGAVICALLAVLAVARSVCSVSYKDVLGRTVGKSRRGTATGFASSAAAVGVIVFALLLMFFGDNRMTLVIGALSLAAAFWVAAAVLFSTLKEKSERGDAEARSIAAQMTLLKEDPQLVRFIVVRGLLVSTALAPPYLILLGAEGFDRLGALVLASALASLVSSYVWGRLSDRSSRRVLQLSGVVGAVALLAALGVSALGLAAWGLPVVLFVLMIAYHGVRQGRSTYLVDMAPEDDRAAYTAVANTVIGVLLLASGLFGALASMAGAWVTVLLFAVMALGAAVVAQGLDEVEDG
ncbi:MFS transporter [Oceaniglobus roseus]|uniref:MFS transporter n=1 Tax=Oceaniglobus roseus TaxID=1737570 RepID=UPI000C7F0EC4|nr:MFS transporter [Kandeliimicrobium roseum]